MSEALKTCVAGFLRNKGKNVVTEKEFLMGISMDLRWMPFSSAEKLLKLLLLTGVLKKDGEYLRPTFDCNAAEVPLGYRPPADICDKTSEKQVLPDLFQKLMKVAEKSGMTKKDFISASNIMKKKLNVDTEVAALVVLRDHGTDISEFLEPAYTLISGR